MINYKYITKKQFQQEWWFAAILGAVLWSVCFPYNKVFPNAWVEGFSYFGLVLLGWSFGYAYGITRKIVEGGAK